MLLLLLLEAKPTRLLPRLPPSWMWGSPTPSISVSSVPSGLPPLPPQHQSDRHRLSDENRPVLIRIAASIHSLHTTKLNRGIMLNSNCYKMTKFNLKFGTTHCTQKLKVVTLKTWFSVCTVGHTCIFLCVCVCDTCTFLRVRARMHAQLHATLCNPMDL